MILVILHLFMTKRFTRKQEPLRQLDLHGVRHSDVKVLVEDFVLENQNYLPIKIITGNSDKMKSIVVGVLKEHGFSYSDGDLYNRGYIDVIN